MLFSWFPVVCPFLDAWIGSSPEMCGKNNFSGKASVFFKLLWKAMFQVPKSTQILILRGLEAVQKCAKKTIFRSLKNCFSAKPQFSSRYCGKQCFRSPSLPKYWFCVDWKQSKHVRKKQFFGAWKIVFLQSPISSHKTIRGHATKNEPQRGIANLTYKQ